MYIRLIGVEGELSEDLVLNWLKVICYNTKKIFKKLYKEMIGR